MSSITSKLHVALPCCAFSQETLPRLWEQTIGHSSTFFVEIIVSLGAESVVSVGRMGLLLSMMPCVLRHCSTVLPHFPYVYHDMFNSKFPQNWRTAILFCLLREVTWNQKIISVKRKGKAPTKAFILSVPCWVFRTIT